MSEPDTLRRLLDGAYPALEMDLDAGWEEVLRRAESAGGVPRERGALELPRLRSVLPRNRTALALVLALMVLLCGTALAAGTGLLGGPFTGFRDWLGAGPGKPASSAAQHAFSDANAASVAHFPHGTELRLLISGDLGGGRYELYGFRAGESLCLQLEVAGTQSPPSCVPARQLQHARQPAHLLVSGRRVHASGRLWTVSYGLAIDAVHAVEIVDSSGRHRAVLADNAFVLVTRGARWPQGAIAIDSRGDEVPVAITRTPSLGVGEAQARLQPLSWSVLESGSPSGSLAWLQARRPRGAPLPESAVTPLLPGGSRLLFARQLRPDPHSSLRVGLALIEREGERQVCEILYEPLAGRLAGCAAATGVFERHYVIGRMLSGVTGSQRYVLVGLASPQVFSVSYMHAGMDTFRGAQVRDGVFAIPMPVSSSVMWLQIDGHRRSRAGTMVESELESGTWRPSAR